MGQGTSDGRNGEAEKRRLGELTHYAPRTPLHASRFVCYNFACR
jgi:hypothetical protein